MQSNDKERHAQTTPTFLVFKIKVALKLIRSVSSYVIDFIVMNQVNLNRSSTC